MGASFKLLDPEHCRVDGTRGTVIETRLATSWRYRRHECPTCGYRWTSYQMLVNPRRLRQTPRKPPDTP